MCLRKMWCLVLLFTTYIHVSTGQVQTYTLHKAQYEITGIFTNKVTEQSKAFNASTSNASVDSKRLNPTLLFPAKPDSFSVWKELCRRTDEEIQPVAIFGPQHGISDRVVRDQCVLAQIPHLQATWQPFDPDLEIIEEEEEETTEEETPTGEEENDEEQEEENAEEPETEEGEQTELIFKDISINFYPDLDEISLAFAQLLNHYGWGNFAVLYEDDYGLLRIQKILANFTSNFPIFVRRLDPDDDNLKVFKEFKSSYESRVIIDCHADNIVKYMTIANNLGIIDHYQHYLFLSLDTGMHGEELLKYPSNITWISITEFDKLRYDHYLSPKVDEWTVNGASNRPVVKFNLETLLMVDMANHVIESIRAVEQTEDLPELPPPKYDLCSEEMIPWQYGPALQNQLLTLNTTGVSGLIKFDSETGKRADYTLYVNEIYGKKHGTVGQWEAATQELKINDAVKNAVIGTQIMDKHFIIKSRQAKPYFAEREACKNKEASCEGERYEGFSVDLVAAIFNYLRETGLNYTYEFQYDDDIKYGSYDPVSKKWSGLIGELLNKKADLVVCDLTITEERKKVVDFSVPFMTLGISILYTKIEAADPEMFSFLNPYSLEVWIYIAMAYCVVSIVLFVCARISPPDWENPQPCDKDPEELENIWNFKNCSWLTMGSIMTQGCDILPKAFGSRWVCSMWWFFAVIVCQTYIAQLSAAMTAAADGDAINSVEDLAKQTKVRYGAIDGGTTLDFFKKSDDKIYQTIYANIDANRAVLVKSNDEGEKRVLSGRNKYAFFMESTTIDYKLKRNCKLRKVGNLLDSKDYGIAMPANSPFRKDINTAILKLKELTVLDGIKNTWWNEKYGALTNCDATVNTDDMEGDLEMKHLYGAFVVLAVGLFISLFVTAAEFFDEVRNIVVREQVTHKEAFIKELKASLNFSQSQKPVQRNPSRAPSVVSALQMEDKQARRAMFMESFLDLEKVVQ